MFRLLHAGLVAAGLQSGAVVTITLLVMLPVLDGSTFNSPPSALRTPESVWNHVCPFLVWSYLIIAIGISFTGGRFVVYTAEYIRTAVQTARLDREQTLMPLLVCLAIPAILVGSFALELPPAFLVEATSYFGCAATASCIWAAVMSVAVACLGAMAHAVKRAFDG
jgi:hypothetical protein